MAERVFRADSEEGRQYFRSHPESKRLAEQVAAFGGELSILVTDEPLTPCGVDENGEVYPLI